MKITMNGCFIPISCSGKWVMYDVGTDLGGVFLSCCLPVRPIEIFRCPLIKSDDTLLVNFPANNFTRTYSVLLMQSLWNSFTWSKMIGHRLHNLHDELLRMQTALRAHLIQLFIKFRPLWKWIPEGLRQKNRVSSCKVICRKVHQ